ncbi:MAG: hypothetical protein JWR77_2482 [Rhizorhabdus sp.]|nr:hypothetical protein [Rhizorhabdus sp.]
MSEGGSDEQGLFPPGVGAELAATRKAQKLEIADIADRTRIPARHIAAIERGDFEDLPALPYSAGFVKTYANMLGLDGQALSRAFRDEVGEGDRSAFEPEAYQPADPSRVPSRLLAMVALGVALLLGMAYLLLRFEGDSSELAKLAADTPEEVVPAPKPLAPIAAPAAVQPAVPSGPIAVMASEDAWLKISERTGSTLYMGVLKAGERFELPATAIDPVLRTGRPQSIKVMLGETALPPVGEPDRLIKDYSLKRDALTALATVPATSVTPADAANISAVPETTAPNP